MNKRKRLGQHFLTSKNIAQKIVAISLINNNDVVLEIGTGRGIMTLLLCDKAKKVVSIERDSQLYEKAKNTLTNENLDLLNDDAFRGKRDFDVLVSNLPYSESRRAFEWLAQQRFREAYLMVQKEFAEKLLTTIKKDRKAISVIATYAFLMEKIMSVSKNNFSPPPKVDSVVLKIIRRKTLSNDLIKAINLLFSYRKKTVQNILKQFGIPSDSTSRLDELEVNEIVGIAKKII